jgi:hypothetical protein
LAQPKLEKLHQEQLEWGVRAENKQALLEYKQKNPLRFDHDDVDYSIALLGQQVEARLMKRPTPYRKDEIRKALEAHDEAASDEFWSAAGKARGWDVSQSSSDALKKRLQREDRASVNLPDKVEKPKKKKFKKDD